MQMPIGSMKKCSVISHQGTSVKATVRYQVMPVKTPIVQNTEGNKCAGEDVGKKRTLLTVFMAM
jgi:hypothetical protein